MNVERLKELLASMPDDADVIVIDDVSDEITGQVTACLEIKLQPLDDGRYTAHSPEGPGSPIAAILTQPFSK